MGSLAEAAAHRLRTRRGVAKVRASMSSVAMAYTCWQKQVSCVHAGMTHLCCKIFRSGKPWLMVTTLETAMQLDGTKHMHDKNALSFM